MIKELGIIPVEEWSCFIAAFKAKLPTTFRITGHQPESAALIRDHLQNVLIPELKTAAADDKETQVCIPSTLPWYPEALGWHIDSSRSDLKKVSAYGKLHSWLVRATENGDISRQEAVSMVPPLLLDVKEDHTVLDLCAAPGSKTAQLVEYMHYDAMAKGMAMPTGMVIANDVDQQRAYMLFHQVKRISSPLLIVCNNDGSFFPNIFPKPVEEQEVQAMRFDRILCDVPCSGDGTLRKNGIIWTKWSPFQATGLHGIQVKLLERAVHMTKPGGRIVYSTCSMNPVENEAVIATLLGRFPDALELVDISQELPLLERRKGLTGWKLMDKDGNFYDSHQSTPDHLKAKLTQSMFPPDDPSSLGLDRCMRIYPHLQDTGAFFVAVLRKLREVSEPARRQYDQSAASHETMGAGEGQPPSKASKSRGSRWVKPGDEPFVPLAETSDLVKGIQSFYGLQNLPFRFMVRSLLSVPKSIYMVGLTASAVLAGDNQPLRVVNAGIRTLELYDGPGSRDAICQYRILSEGAVAIIPFMTERKVSASIDELCSLLAFAEEDSVALDKLSPSLSKTIEPLGCGCILLYADKCHSLVIPLLKTPRGLLVFVPRKERPSIVQQLALLQR